MVNDVKVKATEECVCMLLYKARGGQDALLKDHAKNLYKQSSSRNDSPAKNWVSHQPQLTTHTTQK